MAYNTQYTAINLTTSVARYFTESLITAGWAVYYQATDVMSGTAISGEVTLVPEFPDEPNRLALPPKTRTADSVLVPAFSVRIRIEPYEESRAGLGEDLFEQRCIAVIDGFVATQAQHLAFATMFRNWFREGYTCNIYDYESDPGNPQLLDNVVVFENRQVNRVEVPDAPRPVRYYLNVSVDLTFYD
jgi:hypothetical protein